MAIEVEPGKTVRVTINKTVNRDSARKTLERLFLQDKAIRDLKSVESFVEVKAQK